MKNDIKKILSNLMQGISTGKENAWIKKGESLHEEIKEIAFEILVHSGGAGKIIIPFDIGEITITRKPHKK